MKNTFSLFLVFPPLACMMASCEAFIPERSQGRLIVRFSEDVFFSTRASNEIPDTNDFILTILDSGGKELYYGKYGDSPTSLELPSGSYSVSAVSSEFKTPKFSAPQYGDRQVVVVSSGRDCSGVKLNIAPSFLNSYPNGSLILKSDDGKLLYSYSEKRIAYFNPGRVSLILSDGGTDESLLTRVLEQQEVLVLNVSAPDGGPSSAGGIRIAVDTTRYWSVEDFVIGQGDSKGKETDSAYNIGQARANVGEEDVWVCGYIVGGDLTSSSASFEPPFKSQTNVLIGSRSSVTDRDACLSVQLQKGDIRDALNLVDNPDILGRYVWLRGDVVDAYYGMPGIRNITECILKDD